MCFYGCMNQLEKCSGRGCESPQVHHKEYCSGSVSMSRIPKSALGLYIVFFIMGLHSFDRANSTEVDNSPE